MTGPQFAPAVISPGQAIVRQWDEREQSLVAHVIAPGLEGDTQALRAFSAICKHTGLDPFKKQLYAWKDRGKLVVHIGINGWRSIAARSGEYGGQTAPQWCGPDMVWRDVWLDEKVPPAACRVGVRRTGATEPTYAVVTWKEFNRAASLPIWKEKPAHMLAIRAESHALQKACPEAYEQVMAVAADARATVEVGDAAEVPRQLQQIEGESRELPDDRPDEAEGDVRSDNLDAVSSTAKAPSENEAGAADVRTPASAVPSPIDATETGTGGQPIPPAPSPRAQQVERLMADLKVEPDDIVRYIGGGVAWSDELLDVHQKTTGEAPAAVIKKVAAKKYGGAK